MARVCTYKIGGSPERARYFMRLVAAADVNDVMTDDPSWEAATKEAFELIGFEAMNAEYTAAVNELKAYRRKAS